MKRAVGAVLAAMVVALLPGCSNDSGTTGTKAVPASSGASQEGAPSRATLTAPKLQPPAQEGSYVNEGRPDVVFDPCTWISDEAIQAAGFDPETRERGKDFLAEWTFLVCRFESDTIILSVLSGNVTLEEEIQKASRNGSEQKRIKINGRDATVGPDPDTDDACKVSIRTDVGVAFVNQLLSHNGRIQGADPCVDIEKTAALIEPEIGEGN